MIGQLLYILFVDEACYPKRIGGVRGLRMPKSWREVSDAWRQARRNAKAQRFYDAAWQAQSSPWSDASKKFQRSLYEKRVAKR
jgi:hypothetical protein